MHNSFNKMYLQVKSQRDDYLNQLRKDHNQRLKEIRDTHSNKLKTDLQQKLARDLQTHVAPIYQDKAPVQDSDKAFCK